VHDLPGHVHGHALVAFDEKAESPPVALSGLSYEDVVCVSFHMSRGRCYLLVGIDGKRLSLFLRASSEWPRLRLDPLGFGLNAVHLLGVNPSTGLQTCLSSATRGD